MKKLTSVSCLLVFHLAVAESFELQRKCCPAERSRWTSAVQFEYSEATCRNLVDIVTNGPLNRDEASAGDMFYSDADARFFKIDFEARIEKITDPAAWADRGCPNTNTNVGHVASVKIHVAGPIEDKWYRPNKDAHVNSYQCRPLYVALYNSFSTPEVSLRASCEETSLSSRMKRKLRIRFNQ